MKRNQNKLAGILLLAFALPLTFCTGKKNVDANVDRTLEMVPPIAQEITIKELEKSQDSGNVLVTALLPQIKERYHAVLVNDEKLVLRDDGGGGDEKAGDGVFSIIIQEDLNAFSNEMTAMRRKNMAFLNGRPVVKFVNRQAVPLPQQPFNEIRFDSVAFHRGIRLDLDFFTVPADPALKDHSLMITDLGVVEDPSRTFNPCTHTGNANGVWTFGRLISDMANISATTISAEEFTKNWLDKWMNQQTINGEVVPARTGIFTEVIEPWIKKTTPGAAPTLANWKTFPLDLTLAPFKLEAIVNRLDLRGNSGYTISNAGEGRFVFGVLSPTCAPLQNPGKFTVIFEYGIPKKSCSALKAFATEWYNLKSMVVGSLAYNAALESITNQFAGVNTNPGKPNGNSLNQLRTNEFALGGPFWELREFRIDAGTHMLREDPVTNEPSEQFNRLAGASPSSLSVLANYVNSNQGDVINSRNTIPLQFSGQPFLGGRSQTRLPSHIWDGSVSTGAGFINSDSARHFFSLNTCSGCHGGEGMTSIGNRINDPAGITHNPFLQIAPQGFGKKATLAAFLTGDPTQSDGLFKVNDPAGRPAGSPAIWAFNDLERRAQDLEALVNRFCVRRLPGLIEVLRFKPLHMVH